jgi:hypothetical protein
VEYLGTSGDPLFLAVPRFTGENSPEVYPNPVSNELLIRSEPGVRNDYSIKNTLGQEIMKWQSAESNQQINTGALTPGIYYLTLPGKVVKIIKE